jgi:glycosyltransferase involved in cell wall biosynthesis
MPQISVIMSVFNEDPDFLRKSIGSILSQNFQDFEFVIIDDGSSEGVEKILTNYADTDQRVILIRNDENIGLTKSLNKAIRASTGAFIARMDSDDVAFPNRLERQLDFLKGNSYDFIDSDRILIDRIGNTLQERKREVPKNLKKALMKGNFFTHSTFFGKKVVFQTGYNELYPRAQDYEFLLRILGEGYSVGFMEEPTLKYRVHEAGISNRKAREQELCALRARWDAITKHGFEWKYFPYLLRSFFMLLIPYEVKRSLILKQK